MESKFFATISNNTFNVYHASEPNKRVYFIQKKDWSLHRRVYISKGKEDILFSAERQVDAISELPFTGTKVRIYSTSEKLVCTLETCSSNSINVSFESSNEKWKIVWNDKTKSCVIYNSLNKDDILLKAGSEIFTSGENGMYFKLKDDLSDDTQCLLVLLPILTDYTCEDFPSKYFWVGALSLGLHVIPLFFEG